MMSFTVPLDGCTIVATTTVVTSYSSSADCFGSAVPLCCGSVKLMAGKFIFIYFQYQEVVGCVCMLNYWLSSNDDICPDNYNYSRFKPKDKRRSEKREVHLHGDTTTTAERARVQHLDSVTCPLLLRQGMGSSRAEDCAVHGVTGRLFRAVYTGTRPGVSPAIRAGKGWRGRRELAPRCSATRISCIARTCQDRLAVSLIICTTHTTRTRCDLYRSSWNNDTKNQTKG